MNLWRLCWLLMVPEAVVSDWFRTFTWATVTYARLAWSLGGLTLALLALSRMELRFCLVLPLIGGLASGVTIYLKTGDIRGLYFVCNACLMPMCYGAVRLFIQKLVKPLWEATQLAGGGFAVPTAKDLSYPIPRPLTRSRRSQIDSFALAAGIEPPNQAPWLDMLCEVGQKLKIPFTVSSAEEMGEQKVLFVNDAFSTLTGYSLAQLAGKSLRILDGEHTEPWAKRMLHESLKRGISQSVFITSYFSNGTCCPTMVRLQPVCNEEEVHCYTIGLQVQEKNSLHNSMLDLMVKKLPEKML